MSAATVATLRRDVAAIRARLAPDRPVLTAPEVAARAGIVPDRWQSDLLASEARQMILLCSRQSGKSTVTAVLAAHQAAYAPDSLILLLSPSLRQSGELFRKVREVLAALGDAAPPATETSALRLEFANGSRVLSLPGREATIRGFSAPSLIVEDEASRVDDALHTALRPMLATSGGRLILLSTPWGKRGHFYETWERGGPDWHRVRVTAADVPRIDPAWLAAERAAVPDHVFRAEYGVEFLEPDDQAFRDDDIAAAVSTDVQPLFVGGFGHAA